MRLLTQRTRPLVATLAAIGLIVGAPMLSGCGSPRAPLHSIAELPYDEVAIVGRVVLTPPLAKDEQRLSLGSHSRRNKVALITDNEPRQLKGEPGMSDYRGRIDAELGDEFYVKSGRTPFYILAGVVVLASGNNQRYDQAYLPGGLKVDIRAGDKAVYIGTVSYVRDEFFRITQMRVIDDYERVNAEFRKRFGSRHALRKALATPVKLQP